MAQESDSIPAATAEDDPEQPGHDVAAEAAVGSGELQQQASSTGAGGHNTAPVAESSSSIPTATEQQVGEAHTAEAAHIEAEAQAEDAAATAEQDTQQLASTSLEEPMQEQAEVPLQEGDHDTEAHLQGQAEEPPDASDPVAADSAIDAAESPALKSAAADQECQAMDAPAADSTAEPTDAGLQQPSSSSTVQPAAAAAAAAAAEAQPAASDDLQSSPQGASIPAPAATAAADTAPGQLEGAEGVASEGVPKVHAEADADAVAAAEEPAAASHSTSIAADVSTAAADADADVLEPADLPQQQAEESAAALETAAAAAAAVPRGTDQDDSHVRKPNKAYFVDGVRAINVEVDCGPGVPCKLLHVIMDVSALEGPNKPYLGGFKHKQQGTIYHHASIQTPQDQSQAKKGSRQQQQGGAASAQQQEGGEKLTRQTQTVKEASTSSQTVREAATQMARSDFLLDCSRDRVLTPRPYVTAAVVEQRREAAAFTIQRFSRGWFARKRAGVMREIKAERDAFLAETAAESAQAAYNHKRSEVERRTHPLSKADFVLLESELETWRQQQTVAIKNAGLVQQEEQAALQLLLAKETRLLHTLDKLRVAAHQEKRSTGRQKVLGALAQPKTWSLSNGKKVLVHTPLTVRAAELQQLYRGLTLPSLSLDERLDVLLHVKWVSKEWDTSVTRELVELIDREADLLNRGRSPKTLDGLRKRIAGLFLTCCQNPAFNPEAAKLRVNAVGPNGPEAFEYVLEQQAIA